MDENSIPEHKLCGFLYAVLAVNKGTNLSRNLDFNTLIHIFGEGCEVGFESENGALLSVIQCSSNLTSQVEGSDKEVIDVGVSSTEVGKSKIFGKESGWSTKKRRKIGLVHGSISVVHQLHSLLTGKCLKIISRVISVLSRGDGKTRAVVLIDVYLPIALWSGWQFPRSGSIAAALFRHLSCDWKSRSLVLSCNRKRSKYTHEDDDSVWNLSDCHVLGCKLHYDAFNSSDKRQFELHELFKSLPSISKKGKVDSARVKPADPFSKSGIGEVSDDVLINILSLLGPIDLIRVSATCCYLRSLAAMIMPCMKLKLFPHQQDAVEWMLQRERTPEILPHPLFIDFLTEDGFSFYINSVSGEIVTEMAPTIRDFSGGMFCDEPGLGKTITALSLILKTQGTLADPPDALQVTWCTYNADRKCGYYELSSDNSTISPRKRNGGQTARRRQLSLDKVSQTKRMKLMDSVDEIAGSPVNACFMEATCVVRCTRSLSPIKRNLLYSFDGVSGLSQDTEKCSSKRSPMASNHPMQVYGFKRPIKKSNSDNSEYNETWVQCDACHKWRKLIDSTKADSSAAWFCSLNSNILYQSCDAPEEAWDYNQSITSLPGFHRKGALGGKEENVSFFTGVLKMHHHSLNFESKKVLTWLVTLSPEKLSEMETIGVSFSQSESSTDVQRIFNAFGLIQRVEKGTSKWYYPQFLDNLILDLPALRIALCEPLDSMRLYLSRATLIVVPANLVDHWTTQIQKHVRPGQLRVYFWTDSHKNPKAHNLAWDYDVVITTFNRLSAEWGLRDKGALMQVHWLRIMLDEGHTLGSSLNLTNKLQLAISLTASNRWLLTGTPTPNTPKSQLTHLQPMLKFLHEEAYGENHKSWENGILKPFEAEMEEGRSRLLQLLRRCMISARKIDLKTIPPCLKKATFLNFTEEHARSYNELVVTVRRNILMADWNDPSHVESLLNPKQWKFRSTTIKNVRLSCCVAGHIKVTDAGQDIQDTMDILVESGLDSTSEEYAFIKYNLLHGGNCLRCKEWCRLPVITPCRHLLCLDCVALNSERCTFPGCGNLYEMQNPEILTRPENPNPKWPVPKDLIELQPSYKQDNWDPDWQSTSSSKVTYLVQRLKELQEANRKIIDSIEESQKAPEKVLIFSQFLEHIHVIEQQLTFAGIKFTGMYSPMHSSNKMKSLAVFQHDVNCMALLMDGSAALGLDLSFVTHVFLMEPIWDRSMEEQVISRAHRMGATRPIHVETLAMRGTIEEQMLEFLRDVDECRKSLKDIGKSDHEGTRTGRTFHDFAESSYLAHLSFVRTKLNM